MRRPTRTTLSLAAIAAVACLVAPASAAAADTLLSNETTLSRWAHANDTAKVRMNPDAGSRSIARLRYFTEDRRPEVYLALRSREDDRGRTWVEIRVPARPNGQTGWVPREALTDFRVVRTQLVIDRQRLTATLYKRGRKVFSTRVGVGKSSTPTPAGRFWIREKLPGFGAVYGPLAFGTSAYSDKLTDWPGGGVVGIHGTNQPGLIPGRPSHGCVRLKNSAILRLGRLMPVGTPLLVK